MGSVNVVELVVGDPEVAAATSVTWLLLSTEAIVELTPELETVMPTLNIDVLGIPVSTLLPFVRVAFWTILKVSELAVVLVVA